jgi:predicted RNase H-like HicB family nuclease
MLTEYIEAAMAQIVIEYDEEGKQYIGEIPACRGVIGVGESEEACRQDTQESLEGWILLGVRRGDNLPIIDGIDINPVTMTA